MDDLNIMDLPDLGTGKTPKKPRSLDDQLREYARQLFGDQVTYKKGRLIYRNGGNEIRLGRGGIGIRGGAGDIRYSATARSADDWSVSGEAPLLRGTLSAEISNKDDSMRYGLRYQRSFR